MFTASIAMWYKALWPEDLEFDMEDIKTRGYGPSLAEATAIHYWGEECGTMQCQDFTTLLFGIYIKNQVNFYANLPFAIDFLPQFNKVI
jgi:hypothetical protein